MTTSMLSPTSILGPTLIGNVTIVDGTGAKGYLGDVLLRDGIIEVIAAPGEPYWRTCPAP